MTEQQRNKNHNKKQHHNKKHKIDPLSSQESLDLLDDTSDLGVEVRATPSGRGVFATRTFRPGELVFPEITGQIIDDPDYTSHYCMEYTEDSVLEPHNPYGLANHSCDPNCSLVDVDGTLALQAIVYIEPGREITYDYGWELDDEPTKCLCGSVDCRGWIVSKEDLPKLLRKLHRDRQGSQQRKKRANSDRDKTDKRKIS